MSTQPLTHKIIIRSRDILHGINLIVRFHSHHNNSGGKKSVYQVYMVAVY